MVPGLTCPVASGIPVPLPAGIQPVSPARQGGLPGKSQDTTFLHMQTHILVKNDEHLMFPFLFCKLIVK